METIQVNRCVHCMEDTPAGAAFCPRCGKNPLVVEQPVYCLRPFSILRGKYMVGRMLGRGGFGITYVGWDLTLRTKIAIKECYPGSLAVRDGSVSNHLQWDTSLARDGQWRASCESFLREARKMAKVRDIPEVIRVLDTFEENNTAYIIMDFVEGITLKQWLERRGTTSPNGCVELLQPVMNALSRIHRQGIIHRDISPDNIMIEPDGSLKLLDLGAAKELAPQHSHHSLLVTKSGFSPVEQYMENGQIGPWTDVYALCATLYYCMTGKTVPPALDRLDNHSPLEFRREDFKEPLRPELETALRNGLAVRAEERTQSVDELLRQLGTGAPEVPPAEPYIPLEKPVISGGGSGAKTNAQPSNAALRVGLNIALVVAGWLAFRAYSYFIPLGWLGLIFLISGVILAAAGLMTVAQIGNAKREKNVRLIWGAALSALVAFLWTTLLLSNWYELSEGEIDVLLARGILSFGFIEAVLIVRLIRTAKNAFGPAGAAAPARPSTPAGDTREATDLLPVFSGIFLAAAAVSVMLALIIADTYQSVLLAVPEMFLNAAFYVISAVFLSRCRRRIMGLSDAKLADSVRRTGIFFGKLVLIHVLLNAFYQVILWFAPDLLDRWLYWLTGVMD